MFKTNWLVVAGPDTHKETISRIGVASFQACLKTSIASHSRGETLRFLSLVAGPQSPVTTQKSLLVFRLIDH